jgi:hypothetical protein
VSPHPFLTSCGQDHPRPSILEAIDMLAPLSTLQYWPRHLIRWDGWKLSCTSTIWFDSHDPRNSTHFHRQVIPRFLEFSFCINSLILYDEMKVFAIWMLTHSDYNISYVGRATSSDNGFWRNTIKLVLILFCLENVHAYF